MDEIACTLYAQMIDFYSRTAPVQLVETLLISELGI